MFGESLTSFERLGDQSGRARTLHNLGSIAQEQGDYPEARRLFGEVLTIDERLGDQGGRASTLGQLGLLARQQGDAATALRYMVQALTIFERLRSPHRNVVLHMIAELRTELGEATFVELWQEVSDGRPLPDAPAIDPRQDLLQHLITLIQAPTLNESQRLVEADPGLLSAEADELLGQLAQALEDADTRQLVEGWRMLLARCREVGIAAAFAEVGQS